MMTAEQHAACAEDILHQVEENARGGAGWPHKYVLELLGRAQVHATLARS